MAIKVIITGATGLVGEGVLFECLAHADISQVLMINSVFKGYSKQVLEVKDIKLLAKA